jgi:predicted RNase H-like HicB family nuclease
MTTYRAVVTREGDAWLADIPDVQGAHTFARTLMRLDQGIREVLVLSLDLPDEAMADLSIKFEYHTGDEWLDQRTVELRELRAAVEADSRRLEQATETMAQFLSRDAGLSVRDAAVLLDVSPQRISQLAPKTPRAPRAKAKTKRESVDA